MLLFTSCKIKPMYIFIYYSQLLLLSNVYDISPICYCLPPARLNLCINSHSALSYFPMYGISFIISTLDCSLLCKRCAHEEMNQLLISTLACSFRMVVVEITASVYWCAFCPKYRYLLLCFAVLFEKKKTYCITALDMVGI